MYYYTVFYYVIFCKINLVFFILSIITTEFKGLLQQCNNIMSKFENLRSKQGKVAF